MASRETQQRVLFRFEASAAIGWGHMSRCLALAAALDGRMDGVLVVDGERADLPEAVRRAAVDPEETGSAAPYAVAVVDHYGLAAEDETRLRRLAGRIVAIDDTARPHDADILVDSLPDARSGRYRGLVPAHCRLLVGADYALLDRRFRAARIARADTGPVGSARPPRLLVAMGATDPADASSLVLRALDGMRSQLSITVAIGPDAPHRDALRRLCAAKPHPAELVVGATDMAALYARHDLAVGAPGVSALERACVGLPSILVEVADNQRAVASALESGGVAVRLGGAESLDPDAMAGAVAALARDPDRRAALSRNGRELVDGLGAARVAAHILSPPDTKDGADLVARRLRRSDSDIVLGWQTTPGLRRFSRRPHPPSPEEHAAWIAARLADPADVSEILTLDGRPVALARLDQRGEAMEVSLVVAPEAAGRGIGRAAVRHLQALFPRATLLAHVHRDNAASMHVFESCGFGQDRRYRLQRLES